MIQHGIMYCLAIFAVSIIPGPSMALAFFEGAKRGIKGCFFAALGNVSASLGQGVIALLSLHALISLRPKVLLYIQLIGALYIAYVGITFIRQHSDFQLDTSTIKPSPAKMMAQFKTGFFVAFFNPKAILFFVALFPQFISVRRLSNISTLSAIYLPIALIAVFCFLIYGYLGRISLRIFNESRVLQWIIPALGGCLLLTAIVGFIGVVVKLALILRVLVFLQQ